MNTALLHGLPVVVVAALIALIYRRAGQRLPAPYRLSQPWTHEPILWSAVDEPIPATHSGESVLSVGGGASGRW